MNLEKHVWEGWRVIDFINELENLVSMAISGKSHLQQITNKSELKEFCKDNQLYYKKHIPEVVNYFAKQYNLK